MQQTDKYKLNLIETSDTFSPAPLNENAQKLEAAIAAEVATRAAETAAETAARAAADADLDQRLKAFEVHHAAMGRYHFKTTGVNFDADLGFTPKIVIVFNVGSTLGCRAFVDGEGDEGFTNSYAQIVPGGFRIIGCGASQPFNNTGGHYVYLALA